MTKSEIHAVMVGGFATIAGLILGSILSHPIFYLFSFFFLKMAGSVLAAYISFGISASQLLSASVMAAPAALALAKLFYPETEKSQTKAGDIKVPKGFEIF